MTLSEIAYLRIKDGWVCPGCEIAHNSPHGCPLCLQKSQLSLKTALDRTETDLPAFGGLNVQDSMLDSLQGK